MPKEGHFYTRLSNPPPPPCARGLRAILPGGTAGGGRALRLGRAGRGHPAAGGPGRAALPATSCAARCAYRPCRPSAIRRCCKFTNTSAPGAARASARQRSSPSAFSRLYASRSASVSISFSRRSASRSSPAAACSWRKSFAGAPQTSPMPSHWARGARAGTIPFSIARRRNRFTPPRTRRTSPPFPSVARVDGAQQTALGLEIPRATDYLLHCGDWDFEYLRENGAGREAYLRRQGSVGHLLRTDRCCALRLAAGAPGRAGNISCSPEPSTAATRLNAAWKKCSCSRQMPIQARWMETPIQTTCFLPVVRLDLLADFPAGQLAAGKRARGRAARRCAGRSSGAEPHGRPFRPRTRASPPCA